MQPLSSRLADFQVFHAVHHALYWLSVPKYVFTWVKQGIFKLAVLLQKRVWRLSISRKFYRIIRLFVVCGIGIVLAL